MNLVAWLQTFNNLKGHKPCLGFKNNLINLKRHCAPVMPFTSMCAEISVPSILLTIFHFFILLYFLSPHQKPKQTES